MSGRKREIDINILKMAAIWSYIVGAWCFIGVIALYAMLSAAIQPFISMLRMMGSSSHMPSMAELGQLLNAVVLPVAIVGIITMPIMIFFGYNEYKVGAVNNVGSLKVAGVSAIIVSIAIAPVIYGFYALANYLTGSLYGTGIIVSAFALLIGMLVMGIFFLVSLIAFMVGLSGMKNATGINDFWIAMWVAIASVLAMFIYFLGIFIFPIAIVLFGSGLGKWAKQGGERKVVAPSAEEGAQVPARRQIVYCPYCGAKVEADALFCPTCGSSLKKQA